MRQGLAPSLGKNEWSILATFYVFFGLPHSPHPRSGIWRSAVHLVHSHWLPRSLHSWANAWESRGIKVLSFCPLSPSLIICSPTHPTHGGQSQLQKVFRQGCGDKSVLFYSIIGHLATSLHTIWAHFLDKSNKRHWLAGSDVRPSLLPHRQPRCCWHQVIRCDVVVIIPLWRCLCG